MDFIFIDVLLNGITFGNKVMMELNPRDDMAKVVAEVGRSIAENENLSECRIECKPYIRHNGNYYSLTKVENP